MTQNRHVLVVKGEKAPSVELDPSCCAVYVRFSDKPVHETLEREADEMIVTVDLDKNGEVVGVEAIGFTEFSLGQLMRAAKVRADHIDFSKAKFRGAPKHAEELGAV